MVSCFGRGAFAGMFVVLAGFVHAEECVEHFDHDPLWIGHNNLGTATDMREVEQNFGFKDGRIGGLISPDGRAAYYARTLAPRDLSQGFEASGTMYVAQGPGNTFFGFFKHDTINEWRTPNAMGFRINGRGDTFHVHLEYATARWRAGAGVIGRVDLDADRIYPIEIPGNSEHAWTLRYTPDAHGDTGQLRASFDDVVAETTIPAPQFADGLTVDRFGFLNIVKSVDSPGTLWVKTLKINGEAQDLSQDPHWDALNNHTRYKSGEVRSRFNFGYSPTAFALGAAAGEAGGLFFRGDCREANRLASYGAQVGPLGLADGLHAEGKLVLRRGVTDSSVLLGYFHSEESLRVNPSQNNGWPKNFLGFAIEGPSSEGFQAYPCYRNAGDVSGHGRSAASPHLYPDGVAHAWNLTYDPRSHTLIFVFDGVATELVLEADALVGETPLDRFGFVTTWIDGNAQVLYIDDVRFTCSR